VPGAAYSYGFGTLIGGPLVGVVLALNGAVFAALMAGALAERLCAAGPAR
jgi:LytS/YehU family sensor histidine kinase